MLLKSSASKMLPLQSMLSIRFCYRLLFFCFSIFWSAQACGQSDRGFYGREFWATTMENTTAPSSIDILVSPLTTDSITLYNPQTGTTILNGFGNQYFKVIPGQYNRISVNLTYIYTAMGFGPQGTGLRIRSRRDCQVSVVNNVFASTDVTALLPDYLLNNSREYIINSYGGDKKGECQAAVLAIDTGTTTVEITLSADLFTGQGAGSIFTQKLKQGQVFIFQALDAQNLTGTIVKVKNGCKRIAVFNGTKCAKVQNSGGCLSCDLLYEQCWPSVYLGKTFIVPGVPLNTKYQVSIAAIENVSTVSINGGAPTILNKGDKIVQEISSVGPVVVKSDKPISCVQLLNSNGCNGNINGLGDPSLLNIAPVDAMPTVKKSAFVLFKGSYQQYATIITETVTKPKIYLNGVLISAPSNFTPITTAGRSFWVVTALISNTNNAFSLRSDSGFQVYTYALAKGESYATCISASFTNRTSDFSVVPDKICDPNKPVQFKSSGDSIGNISWFFGDGLNGAGSPVFHTYNLAGDYNVRMLNKNPGSVCPSDTVLRIVKVINGPSSQLPKDTLPCKGKIYKVTLTQNKNLTYSWENGSTSFQRLFQVDALAILRVTDTNGCSRIDTVKIKFKDCSKNDLKLANVFTPNEDGVNDEWKVIYEGYETVNVRIFNRWGALIIDYSLPDDPHWTGKVNNTGSVCPEGTYFYQIQAYDQDTQSVKIVSGSINLIK
jgi:gliding motility-associated-like protein